MADGLAAFVAARLAELAGADWHVFDCPGMPRGDGHCCEVGGWLARDVAAKRAILAEYTAVRRLQELTGTEKDFYRGWVLRHLAAVWGDHPGYRQEWAPAPATISP